MPDTQRSHSKSAGDGRMLFLKEFLRHPKQVASLIPSSRFIESRLVRLADIAEARVVVELGPGTGGTTRAILDALPEDGRLLTIEINPRFVQALRAIDDPRLIAHCGGAERIHETLAEYGLGRPDAVVCGIPLTSLSRALGRRIIRAAWWSLAPGGRFVAYQLRSRVVTLGRGICGEPHVEFELRNIPPERVYCWRKAAERSSGA